MDYLIRTTSGYDISKEYKDKIHKIYYDNIENGWSLDKIEAKKTKDKGMGVFAKEKIYKYEVIEASYAIPLMLRDKQVTDAQISRYSIKLICNCKECQKAGNQLIMPTGFGSLYNSYRTLEENNALISWGYSKDIRNDTETKTYNVIYFARKDIDIGEEIVVYYGEEYYDNWIKQ